MTRLGIQCVAALAAAVVVGGFVASADAEPAGQLYGSGYSEFGGLGGIEGKTIGKFTPLGGLSSVVQASPGYEATLVLMADGTVQASGDNRSGELGDGDTTERKSFGPVPGLSNVTSVAAGAESSYALLSNGTVEAWGEGKDGELGDGKYEQSDVPAPVVGVGGTGVLSHVIAISADGYGAMALLEDGTVVDWGYGGYGELGNGKEEKSDAPVQVLGVGGTGVLSNVVAISAGLYHDVALLSNGTVVDWGYGDGGELGNGEANKSAVPVQVRGVGDTGVLSDVSAISAGDYFNIALMSSGSVAAWGYGYYGELGDGASGSTAEQDAPIFVPGIPSVSAISANSYSALALAQGSLYGWGWDGEEELGNESTAEVTSPLRIPSAPTGIFSLGHGAENYDSLVIQGAAASLSTTSISFPSETVGTTSTAQSVTLENEGPATVTVSGETFAGAGASAFTKTADTCSGATLAAGGSCTVTFTFTPQAVGITSASLAFTTSATDTLPTVTLSGTGTSSSTGTGTPPSPPVSPPAVTPPAAGTAHAAGSAVVENGKALVKLTCIGQGACHGSLELVAHVVQTHSVRGHLRKRTRSIVIGTTSFTIAPGKSETVQVHLSAKGRSLLAKAGKRGLELTVEGKGIEVRKLHTQLRKSAGKTAPRK